MASLSETISELQIGYDTTFELNEFGNPRLRSEIENVKDVIMFILFAKPGQYPSLPNIGLDIKNLLYSHFDELNEDDLCRQIIEQCAALDVYFTSNAVAIKKMIYNKQPSLLIHIEGTETYPKGYMKDNLGVSNRYLIGITFDELNKMIYNISSQGGG